MMLRKSYLLISEKKSHPMSAREITEDDFFVNFEIQMEGILNLLHSKNLLKREYRAVTTPLGKELIKENVCTVSDGISNSR